MDRKCLQCDSRFGVTRRWKVFCSDACRLRYHRENRYCFFCGEVESSHRHHLHPVSTEVVRRYAQAETVGCCRECNELIGDKGHRLIEDQFDLVLDGLRARRGRARPSWDEEELEELGYMLRAHVERSLALYQQYERRIAVATLRKQLILLGNEEASDPLNPTPAV